MYFKPQHTHPYTCKFLYPFDATENVYEHFVTIKAPEVGDVKTRGRNQNFARTKSGAVYVYDFGNSLSSMLKLSFKDVIEEERAALVALFDAITWGVNRLKYVDYRGTEYIVRVYKNTIDEVNQGESQRGNNQTTLYDFTLDLIDISSNPQESTGTTMSSQLAAHIADVDNPHDPRVLATVAAADGTVVVDSVSVDAAKHVTWLANLTYGTSFSITKMLHVTHDGTASSDAATAQLTSEAVDTMGADPGDIVFTTDLSGSGSSQIVRLKCAKAAGSVSLIVRKIKL